MKTPKQNTCLTATLWPRETGKTKKEGARAVKETREAEDRGARCLLPL